jgi:hypothetical protein
MFKSKSGLLNNWIILFPVPKPFMPEDHVLEGVANKYRRRLEKSYMTFRIGGDAGKPGAFSGD